MESASDFNRSARSDSRFFIHSSSSVTAPYKFDYFHVNGPLAVQRDGGRQHRHSGVHCRRDDAVAFTGSCDATSSFKAPAGTGIRRRAGVRGVGDGDFFTSRTFWIDSKARAITSMRGIGRADLTFGESTQGFRYIVV